MRNLLDFLAKYNNWLLFILLEVMSIAMLFQYNSYQGSVWFTSANFVAGKVYELDSALKAFFSLTKVNEELTVRNFTLERQVNQLARLYGKATGDTTVLQRLALGNIEQYKLVMAKVVSNTVNRKDNLITIDKGRADGIEADMGVTSGNGVVGVVYLAWENYWRELSLLKAKSSIC